MAAALSSVFPAFFTVEIRNVSNSGTPDSEKIASSTIRRHGFNVILLPSSSRQWRSIHAMALFIVISVGLHRHEDRRLLFPDPRLDLRP